MLAIDVPSSVFLGLVLAEGGRKMLAGGEPQKIRYMRSVVLLFTIFLYTPVPLIFLNGWPAWQTNYVMRWAGNLVDDPLRAAVTVLFYALTVLPAYGGFEFGRMLIKKGKAKMVRVSYIVMVFVTAFIIYLTREATFKVAPTYEKFDAGEFFPITHGGFFICLLITSIVTWGSLFFVYRRLRKKS
ncbi:MAG: hypothetical protein KAW12_20435 [Candidatus Aminicenantes bacterium]|nr:hypothetical protein [Candidatus Aminicenantes bacterium]